MKLRFQLTIGLILIFTGLVIGFEPFMNHRRHQNQPTPTGQAPISQPVEPAVADTAKVVTGKPVRIEIPSLNINLQVIDGYYNVNNKTWTLTKDKAQYATITPQANNVSGNTFIYGHRLQKVFGNLAAIHKGDAVIITTDNGHKFNYVFRSSYETNPYDDSLFHYKGPAILTLQTCSGVWDQNRQLFTFDFKEVV